jgi:UDP-N-acetylglucosamine 1-carboxyvinyltransferase
MITLQAPDSARHRGGFLIFCARKAQLRGDPSVHCRTGNPGNGEVFDAKEWHAGMDLLKITGDAPLSGSINVAGSKNAALAVLSSVLLSSGTVNLTNVPDISDVRIKLALLELLGCSVERSGSQVSITPFARSISEPAEADVRPIRTSFYVFGPLLARTGHARLPMPGGCRIGERPVDFHIKGLEQMGASIQQTEGHYVAAAKSLRGASIHLDFPSAGATQHLMSAASVAKGMTTIHNAAMEPEVITLAGFLVQMGARIEGAGTSTITITGVESLHGCEFRVPEDRVQAGTYLLMGPATCGKVRVNGILPDHQTALVSKLLQAGAEISEGHDWIEASASDRLKGVRIKTMPYPGFATDIQQPMCAALTTAVGWSEIEETIYESRTGHVAELARMGARISQRGAFTMIDGPSKLEGAEVEASDLRAGAALVLAGLMAKGETTIRNVHYIDRGYQDLERNIRSLGGRIERMSDPVARV